MELFYNENLLAHDESMTFGPEESRHLSKVLRKKVGELIRVTNGKGLEWKGQIISTDSRKAAAKKTGVTLHQKKIAPLHMAIAPTKSNDRLEWFLEKATEIGVTEITPLICDHSERKTIKPERMKKILVGALKQSAQYFLPQLNPLISFEALMKLDHPQTRLIAHCQNGNRIPLHQRGDLNDEILIMIGPEGDFSMREIKTAQNHSFTEITLSSQRLRTETAAIVACSQVATLREISKTKPL
ncbi:MAG: 16S rRNA (uracil(1498)-N(3))-methyltransferase [Flavobacteriaceae bacterium]|jgi:16S rRNA (uracil1498-N3)-methyltransferase